MTEDEIHKIDLVEMSHWWYRGTREICFSLLAPYLAERPSLRILDVGCGTGGNLVHLSRLGDARGIDLSPLCVDYCRRKGLTATVGTMTDLRGHGGPFDLVTMFDVLNQAGPEATVAILSGMADVMAPGGLLAFREPAMPMAGGAHDRAVGIRQRFSRRPLADTLRQAGFEPLRITYFNTLLFPPIVAYRMLTDLLFGRTRAESDVKPAARPINAALLETLRLERRLLQWVDLPFGVSLFAAARKLSR